VDPAGNVYVTGWSNKGDTDETADYVTIKYDPAGEQVWLARYDGPGKGHDEAAALALDSAGNVYVTGMSRNESLDFDSATIKYSQSPPPAFTTSLYFPRLVADPNESTGIALVN